jgi:L-ascorbate metabolism protein UlaG (beta-lactamase superfamily)
MAAVSFRAVTTYADCPAIALGCDRGILKGAWRRRALLLAFCVLPAAPARAQGIQVTYLANEGVLVEGGGARVLIDALFRDSMDPYLRHPRDVQERLETGGKPYDGVLLALATHFHLDHWDAGAVTRFLRSHPSALFASTEQGTAMIPYDVRGRARSLGPASGATSRLEVAGVNLTAFPLEHGTTQNLGFRIELGGRTLAHLGDANPSDDNFRRLTAAGRVDVALVPFWWLLEAEAVSFLKTSWRPGNVVALHFGTTDLGSSEKVVAALPNVWAATKPFESRKY